MKSIQTILFLALLFSFSGKNAAQTVDPKLAAALQYTLDSMTTLLDVKSLSAAVQLPNGATWAGARGVSSLTPLDSVTTAHVYDIGSVAKTITGACMLQLVDEGILTLDDSLHQWLDTFPYISPDITIRQLLRHQSGIFDVLGNPAFQPEMWAHYDSTYSTVDIINTYIQPPLFPPGSGWSYSNTNYMLLGLIISEATGGTYHGQCRERFFTPLGMSSIVLPPFEVIASPLANVWLDLDGDNLTDDAQGLIAGWNSFNSVAAPAGAFFSNASDMAVWMRAYMSGTLLSASLMDEMKTTVNTPLPGGTKYGLGSMERSFVGIKGWGHGGDIGYSSSVFYFPEKDVSVAVLNNDGKNTSWTLAPVVGALLKSYIDCSALPSDANELAQSSTMHVFPNPFSAAINVEMKTPASDFRLVLMDGAGRAVCSAETAQPAQPIGLTGLGGLPAGTYFLQVFEGEKSVGTAKLTKVY